LELSRLRFALCTSSIGQKYENCARLWFWIERLTDRRLNDLRNSRHFLSAVKNKGEFLYFGHKSTLLLLRRIMQKAKEYTSEKASIPLIQQFGKTLFSVCANAFVAKI
jgi:hypothetical protein